MKVPMKATFATQSSSYSCFSPSRCSRTKETFHLYRLLLSILAPFCLLSIVLVVGWFRVITPALKAQQNAEAHPTALPWLETEAACKHTDRVWKDGDCWDKEHSPDF
jgi:hypothetical protein